MRAFLGLSLMALLASCQSASKTEILHWNVKAPPKVGVEQQLRFRVETTNAAGEQVKGVQFNWKVDWAGNERSQDRGYSFKEQLVWVKGAPGTTKLRIFVYDPKGNLVEVAGTSFEVVAHWTAD